MSRHDYVHPIFRPLLDAIYPSTGVTNENVLPSDAPGLCVRGVRREQPRDRDDAHSAQESQPLRAGCDSTSQATQRELTEFHSPAPLSGSESVLGSASAAPTPPAAGNGASPVHPFVDAAALDFDRQHRAEVAHLMGQEDY